jgi:pilus assembly protein CpaF
MRSAIMCNPDGTYWSERDGLIDRAIDVQFGDGELHAALEVIASKLGRQLDPDHPIMNARLPDGSRVAAMIPPVVGPHPLLTIRKFRTRRYSLSDLTACGTVSEEIAGQLRQAILDGQNILISGATGSGKTTLLNALANEIPDHERILLIEDVSEIRLSKPHVISTEAQIDTHKKEISFDALLRASLRHRPDRIILGEVRGPEARTLLDAMSTGHRGTLATIHANSATSALSRLANLALRADRATYETVEREARASIDTVVQMSKRGARRIVSELFGPSSPRE